MITCNCGKELSLVSRRISYISTEDFMKPRVICKECIDALHNKTKKVIMEELKDHIIEDFIIDSGRVLLVHIHPNNFISSVEKIPKIIDNIWNSKSFRVMMSFSGKNNTIDFEGIISHIVSRYDTEEEAETVAESYEDEKEFRSSTYYYVE